MDTVTALWVIFAVLFAIIECMTVQLVSIWFCVSSVVAAVLYYFTKSLYVSMIVFVVLSAVLILATRPFVKRVVNINHQPTNADRIIGKKAIVTTKIEPDLNLGQIKVDGQVWSAKSDEIIFEGETVEIEKIEGVKVVVKK